MKVEVNKYPSITGEVTCVTFTNAAGASVTLSSLGAAVVAINVPDGNGTLGNVVVKADNDQHIWCVCAVGDDEVQFGYRDTGDADARVTYRWTEDNVLEMYLTGAVGLIGRSFLNLDGKGSIADEYLWLNASRYLNSNGASAPVADTPLDFTVAKPMGQDFNPQAICWLINDWEDGLMNEAAVLASHSSHRQLNVFTTLPAMHIDVDTLEGISLECIDMPQQQLPDPQQLVFLEFSTF